MSAEPILCLMRVMRQNPDLTIDGLGGLARTAYRERRARLLIEGEDQFSRALEWLKRTPRTKVPNRDAGHSYAVKHAAERWAGDYVSNGALIAAALHLGIPVRQCPSQINCWLAIASRRSWPSARA